MINSLTSSRFCLTARQEAVANILFEIAKKLKAEEKAKNEQQNKDTKK